MFRYRKYQKMHLFNMWLYLKQFLYYLLLFTLKICKRAVGQVHFSESFFCILTEIRVYFKYFYHMYVHVMNQKKVHGTLKSRFYSFDSELSNSFNTYHQVSLKHNFYCFDNFISIMSGENLRRCFIPFILLVVSK